MIRPLFILLILSLALSAFAEEVPSGQIPVDRWLILGPLAEPQPLFLDSADTADVARYLQDDAGCETWRPTEGTSADWLPAVKGAWVSRDTDRIRWNNSAAPAAGFAATYILSSRWQETEFTIRSSRPLAVWLDGQFVSRQTSGKDSVYELKPKFLLHRGKHLLLVKSVNVKESPGEWTLTLRSGDEVLVSRRVTIHGTEVVRQDLLGQ